MNEILRSKVPYIAENDAQKQLAKMVGYLTSNMYAEHLLSSLQYVVSLCPNIVADMFQDTSHHVLWMSEAQALLHNTNTHREEHVLFI